MKPVLSVIIPVYDAEKFLPRAIESVQNVTLENIEILIINDASPGNCKEIVDQYDNIRYIEHKRNKGLFLARATGIEYARGEYIVHLDADDWVAPDIYEKAHEKAQKHNSEVVFFNVTQYDEQNNSWIEPNNQLEAFENKTGKEILDHIFLFESNRWIWHVCWNKLIKKETARELLTYIDTNRHLNMYEDLLWSAILFFHLKERPVVSAVAQYGLNYYRHTESITLKHDYKTYSKKLKDIAYVLRQLSRLLNIHHLKTAYALDLNLIRYNIYKGYFKKFPKKFPYKKPITFLRIFIFLNRYPLHKDQEKKLYKTAQETVRKAEKEKIDKISIFGTGKFGQMLFTLLSRTDIKIISFTETKPDKSSLYNLPVYSLQTALEKGEKNFIIGSLGSCVTIKKMIAQRSNEVLHIISRLD